MKKFYILMIVLLIVSGAKAQSCLPQGITFSTQAEIDNFQTNYPNCTEIEGDVTIQWSDITNLNGLNVLTSIGGDLSIGYNDVLTSLTGLNSLTSIGGNLNIGLGTIYGGGNPALTSLSGLEGLTSIGGGLNILRNDALTSLTGLEGLTSIGGSFIFAETSLVNLSGLENLTSIGGDLATYMNLYDYTIGNPALTSLTGLNNLTSIGEGLFIKLIALTSLTGLNNLTSIGGGMEIFGSDALTSLTGLDNIEASSITDLTIIYNPSLSTCQVQSICDYLVSPNGTVNIHDNAVGCSTYEEVEAACGVGLDESAVSSRQSVVNIYPNPASTTITIETPTTPNKNTFLTIYSISSQQLINRRITEQQTVVDVSGLSQGVYFLKVTDDKTVMVGKFVKN